MFVAGVQQEPDDGRVGPPVGGGPAGPGPDRVPLPARLAHQAGGQSARGHHAAPALQSSGWY